MIHQQSQSIGLFLILLFPRWSRHLLCLLFNS